MEEQDQKQYKSDTIYKKMFKSSKMGGLISVNTWFAASKVIIDIGAFDPNTNALSSSTKCYVDAFEFGTYLQSIIDGTAKELYPARAQCPSPESFLAYGGKDDVARVFKSHYWGAGPEKEGDSSAFVFKCGHFKGNSVGQGAIQPVWNEKISADMIKMNRVEVKELWLRLNVALNAGGGHNWPADWFYVNN